MTGRVLLGAVAAFITTDRSAAQQGKNLNPVRNQ